MLGAYKSVCSILAVYCLENAKVVIHGVYYKAGGTCPDRSLEFESFARSINATKLFVHFGKALLFTL